MFLKEQITTYYKESINKKRAIGNREKNKLGIAQHVYVTPVDKKHADEFRPVHPNDIFTNITFFHFQFINLNIYLAILEYNQTSNPL